MENVIEHAFVVSNSEAIHTGHLPERLQNMSGELDHTDERELVEKPLDNAEKELIESMLKKFNGNRIKTAEALGINKTTLWRKMKKFNLK